MVRYRQSLVAGIGGVLVASVFLLRTDLVLGPYIAAKIADIAQTRRFEIEVGQMRPSGLTGLAFSDVAISFDRGNQGIDAHFDQVVVFPTLTYPPKISAVEMRGGFATVRPRKHRVVDAKKHTTAANKTAPAPKRPPPDPIQFTLDDVQFVVPYAAAPIRVAHAEGSATRTTLETIRGYGSLPNGETFAVESKGKRIELRSERPIRLAENVVGIPLPDVQFESAEYCASCDERASLKGVQLQIGNGTLTSPSIGLQREAGRYSIRLDEVAYDAVPARIVEWKAEVFDGEAEGKVRIEATEGGALDIRWGIGEVVSLQLSAKAFPLGDWDAVNPYSDLARATTVSGNAAAEFDPRSSIGSLDFSFDADDARIHISRISNDPIALPKLGANGKVLFDLDAKTISVTDGRLRLEASDPLTFHGYATDARRGLVFQTRVDAPRLNAVVARDALPKSMTRVIRGANIDGDFSFWFEAGGHTAYPEGLHLDGELSGDVKILTDGPEANVLELRAAGPPKLDAIKTDRWVAYAEFPILAPRVLLAAEDAQFFRHDGFDWPGFQRAMIHNLKRGELERGASTLTQQVIKNLYLGGERTISRKIQEMYLTWRIETEIEKERILEIYMNIAPWGPNVHGMNEAATYYFDADLASLSVAEIALLAAILPNPFVFGKSIKLGRLPLGRLQKVEHIASNLRFLGHLDYSQYAVLMKDAKGGKFGRLQLTICDDDTVSQLVVGAPSCESLR